MPYIAVSGSLAYDRIMDFPGLFSDHVLPEKVHTLNVSFVVESVREHYGGTAGNIAYNLALLGQKTRLYAAVGHDFTPYRAHCERQGMDLTGVRELPDERTAAAYIITDSGNNQITAFHVGAMRAGGVVPATKPADSAWAIVAPGHVEDMVAFPAFYREHSLPFLFDPGQQITTLSAAQLENGIFGSQGLIVNDYELSLVLQKLATTEDALLEKTAMLVVTLGEQGSRIRTQEKEYIIPPARPAQVADPTGAGDAYRAGLLTGLMNGWPLETTGKLASMVACYAVETHGTQEHTFTVEEVRERYRDNFGEELPEFIA